MKTKFKYNSITVYAKCSNVDSMLIENLKINFRVGGKLVNMEQMDRETRLEIKELAHEHLLMVKESQDELNFGE